MVAVKEEVPAQLVVARGSRQMSLQPGMPPIPQVSPLRQARCPVRRALLVRCCLQARRALELRLLAAAPCSRELVSSRSPLRRLSAQTTPPSRFRRSFDQCSVSRRHYRPEVVLPGAATCISPQSEGDDLRVQPRQRRVVAPCSDDDHLPAALRCVEKWRRARACR